VHDQDPAGLRRHLVTGLWGWHREPPPQRFDHRRSRSRLRQARQAEPTADEDRPTYPNAAEATVITVDRGRYRCLINNVGAVVTAMKARSLGRTAVIVGDRVRLAGDSSGDDGTLARIVEVNERETVLRRTADDDDPFERPIVANADQLVIVAALADPPHAWA